MAQFSYSANATKPAGGPDPQVVEGSNQFGWNLLSQLVAEGTASSTSAGIFISPAGITTCLYLAVAGAEGETRRELLKSLGVDAAAKDVEKSARNLISRYEPPSEETSGTLNKPAADEVVLHSANGVWVRDGLSFSAGYLAKAQEAFEAETGPLNVAAINAWVARRTENRIPSIINEISADTIAILTNAVYFRGRWKEPFIKMATKDAEFTRTDGSVVNWPFMNRDGDFEYGESPLGKAVVLPYASQAGLRMIAVLPNKSPAELLRSLDKDKAWSSLVASLTMQEGSVSLPRFQARCSFQSSEMMKAMQAAGIRRAFSAADAEFDAMVPRNDVQRTLGPDAILYIDKVAHELFLNVDEVGTEVVAATVTVTPTVSIPDSQFELKLDRPFLIVIEDPSTKTILFAGVLLDPSVKMPE
jgi:serpin B